MNDVAALTPEARAAHKPLPARCCRCGDGKDIPYQEPGEAARCAKCGLRLRPERALALGARPDDFDPSAALHTAEAAEDHPASAPADPEPAARSRFTRTRPRTGLAAPSRRLSGSGPLPDLPPEAA